MSVKLQKFILKAAINSIIVVSMLLWMSDATFMESLLTAVALTVIAWVVGDQIILRKTNNLVATIADAALAFLFLWVVSDFLDWTLNFTELVMIVAVLGIAEFFFHRVLGVVDEGRM